MIDQKELEAVRVIVTHDNCSDGLAAALICRDVLHDAKILWAFHSKPSHNDIEAVPNMLFVDIAPPPGREQEFLDAGAIVLDHHKGAEAVVQKFVDAGQGVFADEKLQPGVSGAVLAFLHVYLGLQYDARTHQQHVWDLAKLIGIRDTWQKDHEEWELAQAAHCALMAFPRERWLRGGHACLTPDDMEVGRAAYQQRLGWAQDAAAAAFVSDYPGCRLAIFNDQSSPPLISDAADILRDEKHANVVAGFLYDKDRLRVSLRSDGSVDVAAFAKTKGGGGHTKAAAYYASAEDRSPHARIMRDFEAWRRG